MTNEIPRQEWKQFFDGINKNYTEWQTNVEMLENDIGAQVLIPDGLSFSKIVEYKNRINAILIILDEKTNARQTRTIFNPQKVFFETVEDNPGGVIEIDDKKGGKTLVHLIKPLKALAAYLKPQALAVV